MWLCEQLRAVGISADHEKHPVSPTSNPVALRGRVLVTFKKWGPALERYDHVLHLVRHPLRVIDSAVALTAYRPKLALTIAAYICGAGMRAAVAPLVHALTPPALMAHTLWILNDRASRVSASTFRLEAIAERVPANRNQHVRTTAARVWPQLFNESASASGLFQQAEQYGYF